MGLNLFAIWKFYFLKVDFYLVEKLQLRILLNMTDTYNQLKNELKVLYPDVTETELKEMTDNLIDLFRLATEIIKEEQTS